MTISNNSIDRKADVYILPDGVSDFLPTLKIIPRHQHLFNSLAVIFNIFYIKNYKYSFPKSAKKRPKRVSFRFC